MCSRIPENELKKTIVGSTLRATTTLLAKSLVNTKSPPTSAYDMNCVALEPRAEKTVKPICILEQGAVV
jgi:hypothetical protein